MEESERYSEMEKDLYDQMTATTEALEKARRSIEELENQDEIQAVRSIEGRLGLQRKELLTTGLRYLGRPFRKLLLASERGEFSIPLEHREALERYLKKPFTTFVSEGMGYPRLKTVLWNLEKALAENKLGIKERKARKAREQMDLILNKGLLNSLHEQTLKLSEERKLLLSNENVKAARTEMIDLRTRIESLRQKKGNLERNHEQILEQRRAISETIAKNLQSIEDLTFEITGERIQINVEAEDG